MPEVEEDTEQEIVFRTVDEFKAYLARIRALPAELVGMTLAEIHAIDRHILEGAIERHVTLEFSRAMKSRGASIPIDMTKPLYEIWKNAKKPKRVDDLLKRLDKEMGEIVPSPLIYKLKLDTVTTTKPTANDFCLMMYETYLDLIGEPS